MQFKLLILQIADCLGIHYTTLLEETKENPEFSEALKRGRALGISQVTNSLFESALSKGCTF